MGLFGKGKKQSQPDRFLSDLKRLEMDMEDERKRPQIIDVIITGANPPEIMNALFELGGYRAITWPDVVKVCEKYTAKQKYLKQALEVHKRAGYYSG